MSNYKIIWINYILFLLACPVSGQVNKTKQLTASDYKLWSNLTTESISEQGRWVSYSLSYESTMDTLFVKNTVTDKTFEFAKGFKGKFLGETWFGCLLPENRFHLQNLITGKIQVVDQVQSFVFVNEGQYILLFCNSQDEKTKIIIKNLKGAILDTIVNVTSFSLSPKSDKLAFCTSNSNKSMVGLLQFGKKIIKSMVTSSNDNAFENIVWHREGTSIVFVTRSVSAKAFTASTILFYKIKNKQLFQYDTKTRKSWPKEMVLVTNYVSSLGISDDEECVFFKMKKDIKIKNDKNNLNVQIWNTKDKELYPLRTIYDKSLTTLRTPRVGAWWPEKGKLRAVGDNEHPNVLLNGNQQWALVYNPDVYKPSSNREPYQDYYLVDIATNVKTLFLKKQYGSSGYLFFSPQGKYIVYFRAHNWWVYSIANQKHTNITKNKEISFFNDSSDQPEEPAPYGLMGWTKNDASLLIYDQFDIWEFSMDKNRGCKKLTQGRERKQIFRLANIEYWDPISVNSKPQMINLENGVTLKVKAIDNSKSGYVRLNKNRKIAPIVFESKLLSSIKKAKKNNVFTFVKEDFNDPPELIVKSGNAQQKTVFKSNPQHFNYKWGFSRLIKYKNSKESELKGVLFYPFNYNAKKQYPMIVNIYEKQTHKLHKYTNPGLLNGAEFNITFFTSQGYFVLLPDIVYEIGNPGFSAFDCVMAATKTALSLAPIDKNKLGIVGHSFGGYETNFIITQTNMFAAAVAGAGVSDLTSFYFSVNKGELNSNAWRLEYQQFRMGKPWFENKEGYLRNSPLNAVSNVTTPLLSYTGEEDPTVDPYQSMEFYIALRRLKKEHIMLIYPKDDHAIQIPENQIDLTGRLSDWFGYYLKEEKRPDWFEPQ